MQNDTCPCTVNTEKQNTFLLAATDLPEIMFGLLFLRIKKYEIGHRQKRFTAVNALDQPGCGWDRNG